MKILEFSTFDEAGGAGRVARRLHDALLRRGHGAILWAQEVSRPTNHVASPLPGWRRATRGALPLLDALPVLLRYPAREPSHWATGWMPSGLGRRARLLNPDVVHLHWICRGLLGIPDIADLRQPIVWTLHDAWPFTGGCHVPGACRRYESGCGACPQLASSDGRDLSRRTLDRKQRAWSDLSLQVVTPSRWLGACAAASALWRDRHVEVIPNGLDTDRYAPGDRTQARQRLGLPPDVRLVGVAAFNATRDRNKGFDLLQQAIADWPAADVELVVAGERDGALPIPWPVHYLGAVADEDRMIDFYRALDVLVHPSRSENFPNVVAEAMSCGLPVAAFRVGGLPELIDSGSDGILAQPEDPDSLASAMRAILDDAELANRLGAAARRRAERELGVELMATRYEQLYENVRRLRASEASG